MPKRIVTIGGGNGQSELLRYLKDYGHDITAVVTMMDSGGSSGRLRKERGVLPPGDLRRVLAALASEEQSVCNWEDRGDDGHAQGNMAIVNAIEEAGGLVEAVRQLNEECKVQGMVLPVTTELTDLVATYDDGQTEVRGEESIDVPQHDAALHISELSLDPPVSAPQEVVDALQRADCIVLTMGDLYTSVIPNLLVDGVTEAILASGAPVVYICNRVTKPGETHGYTTAKFAEELNRYLAPASLQYMLIDLLEGPVGGYEPVAYEEPAGDVKVVEADLADDGKPGYISGSKSASEINTLCESF